MPPKHVATIRKKLLRWYASGHRELPWRRSRDPYAIWISETMLQQTQVATVVPYYERFLKRFPTVRALARAPLPDVLVLWSGLGYYRRAENLSKAAREIVLRHRGRIPRDYDELLSLPGIGQYTAGALMSIAFDLPYPAVDANARRALSRIFFLRRLSEVWKTAKSLTPGQSPGDFNQALMELGATVCLPKAPRCGDCPLACDCEANRRGGSISAPAQSKAMKNVLWPVAIIRRQGKVLLHRRPRTGLLAGLWEFPGAPGKKAAHRSLNALIRELRGRLERKRRIGVLRHSITDKKIRAPIFLIELAPLPEPRTGGGNWRWVEPAALSRYPVSSMTLKAAKILTAHETSSR